MVNRSTVKWSGHKSRFIRKWSTLTISKLETDCLKERERENLVSCSLKENVENQRTKEDISGEYQLKKEDLSTLITENSVSGKKKDGLWDVCNV